MAYYAALSSAIESLDDILNPNRYPNFLPVKTTTITSLHQRFTRLLDSLHRFSSVPHPAAADRVQTRIRDAAYKALDIIDHLTLLAQIADQLKVPKRVALNPEAAARLRRVHVQWRNEVPKYRRILKKVLCLPIWTSFRLQLTRSGIERKLQKVGREVDSIIQELNASRGNQTGQDVASAAASEQEQPLIGIGDTTTMVGFEEHLATIKDQLFGSSPQLQVLSIVGMGGIGKTTLARNIFEDALILQEFDFRAWVVISQDYNVVRVLQHIVNSLGMTTQPDEALGEMDEMEREIALKTHIHKYLNGRKFLIIIDDVWSAQVWDDIKHVFPCESMRSRIVLTTRLFEVAEYVGSTDYLHQMQLLTVDESWALLQEKSFSQEDCPLELVDVGKLIASKCGGLPLAIVIIGGILSNNRTLQYWENVARNVGSVLSTHDEHLSDILALSYNHLPHGLKPCFLHMGSFPEDYEINTSKLIRLWIAEGFLKSDSNSKSLEKVGNEYLEDLVKRSLVIITKKRADGGIKSCVMHDLLRDFCRQRGLQEQFFRTTDQKGSLQRKGIEKVRRIILDSVSPFAPCTNDNGKYVRSICLFSKETVAVNANSMKWDSVNLLKILDVSDSRDTIAPHALLGKLNLKYLAFNSSDLRNLTYRFNSSDLRFTETADLKPILVEFQNLETLIISNYKSGSIFLPPEIWKMSSLRYLILDSGVVLPAFPDDIHLNRLEHLHTLETVYNLKFTNGVTHTIPNVRKLKIFYNRYTVEMDDDIWNQFCLNNLVNLLQLEKLNISFAGHVVDTNSLCRSFVFPQNLMKLCLIGCKLPWEALTVMGVGSLKRLQVLKLGYNSMVGQVWEPVDGEFLELKFLLLERLNIIHWEAENTHFPKLQHLKINECRKLEEIPLDIGEIGTLEFITVLSSPGARDSARKILDEQHDLGNYGLRVTVHDDPFWDAKPS